MKTRNKILMTVVVLFVIMALRPIYKPTLEQCALVKGHLISIAEAGGPADVAIRLRDDSHRYYINRGIEQGVNTSVLRAELVDNEVEVYYVKHWTPLDPMGTMRHVSRVVYQGAIIYDEIEQRL